MGAVAVGVGKQRAPTEVEMQILVVYATRLGSTRAIAERIAAALEAEHIAVTVRDAAAAEDPARYQAFVIGSAVYAGHWLAPATEFVERNRALLATRPAWVFSSGPVGRLATSHEAQPPSGPARLADSIDAREHRVFAGAFDRNTLEGVPLGRIEGLVARTFIPEGDFRDWSVIEAWARHIARDLTRVPELA
jgi:menaquinone-dependent protoporphyrinogen oxidase